MNKLSDDWRFQTISISSTALITAADEWWVMSVIFTVAAVVRVATRPR